MVNIAQCEFDSDRLSVSSVNALNRILEIIDRANLLMKVVSVIPFFDIFLRGKPHEKIINVAAYDWKEFTRVMRSVGDIERKLISDIAYEQWTKTQGKENEFWKCVYQAM